MQRESNWRIWFVVVVTFICLILIYPTAHYILFEFTTTPPVKVAGQDDAAFQKESAKYDKTKQDLQRGAIKLGLDLIGGVDVLLKIDMEKARAHLLNVEKEDITRILTQSMITPTFTPTKDGNGIILKIEDKSNARQAVNALRDFFKGEMFQNVDPATLEKTGQIELRLSPIYVNRKTKEAIESAEKSIRERVDRFGVTQPSVSLQGNNAIRVQVPGEKDPEYVISQVIRPARLEFYALHDDSDRLAATLYDRVKVKDARGQEKEEFRLKPGAVLPAGYIGMPSQETKHAEGAVAAKVIQEMCIVKQEPAMVGGTLQDAYVETNPTSLANPIEVALTFDRKGAVEFRNLSKKYLHKQVAIVLDGIIYSHPVFQSVIPDGRAVITGSFSAAEARDLALVLKAGAMPAELTPAQKTAIGPSLGGESIDASIRALVIAGTCITAFMIIYYGMAGVISIVALVLNVLMVVACLGLFNATLTLSGIGGLILTIGMAVDTNVLIYERIREEVWDGRPIAAALRAGFNRAFSVIVDSHLTTLLTAAVLLQFGKGSVQGFALTMIFGLMANLFTGLTVTYAICRIWVTWRNSLNLGKLAIFRNPTIPFINMRYVSFSISGLMLLTALLILTIKGPEYAVDFQGGVITDVRLTKENPTADLTNQIGQALSKGGLPGEQARVQKVTNTNQSEYLLRVGLQTPPGAKGGDVTYTQKMIEKAMLQGFKADEVQFLSTESVSNEVGQQFQQIAFLLVIASSIAILAYLWFRFELVFGIAAVIALLHDFIFVLGLMVFLNYQVSLDVVSGLMILLGFSVNDTIVIFDRIRENSHTMHGRSFHEICDHAMNRSLSRTLITSGTVLIVMIIMFFWGGYSLKPLAMTMIIGSIVGTYSSDFIAAPLVFWWNERQKGKLSEMLGHKKAGSQALEGQPLPQSASPALAGGGQARPSRGGRR